MKKFYNAIFTLAEEGGYIVIFPDIPEALTQGDTMEEAYEMAFDVLGLALQDESGKFHYPVQTNPSDLEISSDSFLVAIQFDEMEYLKKHSNLSVKKTLSIPQWLNAMAIERNINFSQTLQEALKVKLNLI